MESKWCLLEGQSLVCAEQDGVFSFSLLRVVRSREGKTKLLATASDSVFDPAAWGETRSPRAWSGSSRMRGRPRFRLFWVHVWHRVLTLSKENQADLSVKTRVHVMVLESVVK